MTSIPRPTQPLVVHSAELAAHMAAHGHAVTLAPRVRPLPQSDLSYPPHGPLYR